MDNLMDAWDESYGNRDNFVFYPHEEVIRFTARHIRKRVGIHDYADVQEDRQTDRPARVLDLGCGIGRHVIFLCDLGLEAYGIDLSENALNAARLWATEHGVGNPQKRFIHGDVRELPWRDKHFDYAVSHGVLDSMPFRIARGACAELSRVMNPGGLLYCDLISGDDSTHSREFADEEIVSTTHENGTIQSYFNMARIEILIQEYFAIEDCVLIRREDVFNGGYSSRYHLVLRNIN